MPTATDVYGYQAINLGPVTTTFTAAASCSTHGWTAYLEVRNNNKTASNWNYKDCTQVTFDNCMPQGKEYDSHRSEAYKTIKSAGQVLYHSPGLGCPSGWTTAGTVVGDGATGTGRSGVFASNLAARDDGKPQMYPVREAYVQVLDKSETLVWCCEDGYAAHVSGVCHSSVAPMTKLNQSTACNWNVDMGNLVTRTEYRGSSLTTPVVFFTDVVSVDQPGPITYGSELIADWTAYLEKPVVAIIHGDKVNMSVRNLPSILGVVTFGLVASWVAALFA